MSHTTDSVHYENQSQTSNRCTTKPRANAVELICKSSLHFLMHHQFNDMKHSNIYLF